MRPSLASAQVSISAGYYKQVIEFMLRCQRSGHNISVYLKGNNERSTFPIDLIRKLMLYLAQNEMKINIHA